MADANEVEFGNQASKVRFQDDIGQIKNKDGEAVLEVNNDQQIFLAKSSPQVYIDKFIDDDSMGTASATSLATSESIKAYVDAAGGGGLTITSVASGDSPVTGAVDTVYIVNSSGGNVEIDLPAVSGNSGKTIDVLHKTIGNDCIVDPSGSETINGNATSITMNGVAYQNITLICDGTEWYIR
tara:strand:- start:168 stop:716 length:549 start_codon:yes stop_codon:yes gene_type:complete